MRKGGSEQAYGEETVSSTVKDGRFQRDEGVQAKRVSLEVEGSMSG